MKFLISFLLLLFFLSSNLYSSEDKRDNFLKESNENTKKISPELSEQLKKLIKNFRKIHFPKILQIQIGTKTFGG